LSATAEGSLGGKAAGLLRLSEVVAVPRFIVLAADWIDDHSGDLDSAVERRLQESALSSPFAVRSSAGLEDGLIDSYAGLFDTRLGVDRPDVADAVRHVCDSVESLRVEEYKLARGVDEQGARMNVIVQQMVAAEVSGVAFSRDPTDPDVVLIEAVRGVGEELVAGAARPDRYRVSRRGGALVEEQRGRQFAETLSDGTRRPLRGREIAEPRLREDAALRIAMSVLSLEPVFAEAVDGVDVEWAMDAQGVKFLQCRPITTGTGGHRTGGRHA
jgi:phosphoenolpyruvate synthase/pyruvate phosphate dikinase